MKLTKAIEALENGNHLLGERIRTMTLQGETLLAKAATARKEWEARGNMLTAMKALQDLMPENETINFVVPGDYE